MKKLIVLTFVLSLASCVSMQKYNDLEGKYNEASQKNAKLEKQNHDLGVDLKEAKSDLERTKANLEKLQNEFDALNLDYRSAKNELDKLNAEYDEMTTKYSSLLAGNRTENQKLIKDLQDTRADLAKREGDLNALEAELNRKKADLDKLMEDFKAKEARVNELQAILDKKDKDLKDLKDKMMAALMGFKDKGLSVYTKNGKVYVSMDEKLLFASGSWEVATEGKNALREVGNVLQKNPDINVLIEGHTDNVPYNGKGEAKDNWDLSVMRATSIVKILLENKGIASSRITAGGRGEYAPLVANDSKENRAKNRRTEIILTPKLNELLEVLGTN